MSWGFFIIGSVIFIIYVATLLTVIGSQHRKQRQENYPHIDDVDTDGMGDYSRIPNKKPKNRA